jgi:hypothetical protein
LSSLLVLDEAEAALTTNDKYAKDTVAIIAVIA